MPVLLRKATVQDAPAWLALSQSICGSEPASRRSCHQDPAWVASQLQLGGGSETWVAEDGGRLAASISVLDPGPVNENPVASLGRHLNTAEALASGASSELLEHARQLAHQRGQIVISRVRASNQAEQQLHEAAGFRCVGFQPSKHALEVREDILFYCWAGDDRLATRLPISDSLPQVYELAAHVLRSFGAAVPMLRDGATGYPLDGEVTFRDGTAEDFELWQLQARAANPPIEISGTFNRGSGWMRIDQLEVPAALFALREGRVVAGILYLHDSLDRSVRLVDSFSNDQISTGCVLQELIRLAQENLMAVYVEMDVLASAPRLLKAAEQAGFIPVAYLPATFTKAGQCSDVVKLIKLNAAYSRPELPLTTGAQAVVDLVDASFQDFKMGIAIINLLRALPFFVGLGDGELRKIARLFTQKLYRPGEPVFYKGDASSEAYVVMRGQIDIILEPDTPPIASVGAGGILGELAFLDGSPRTALALPRQPSILLVVQRQAFYELVQREPHLGMVVMRNIGLELSRRLRKTNESLRLTGR